MNRRAAITAGAIAVLFTAAAATAAAAAPIKVNVRIEGKSETLFEGPVLAEPHGVKATSDEKRKLLRRCNGIDFNDPENTVPAPTPTSVSADAMSLIGETFNGEWYAQYMDYFITRWGPDEESQANGEYWGVLVNNVFTDVGGCQYQLHEGDEVLWVYNAFKGRPTLALFPVAPAYNTGSRPLTATAKLNEPFEVEVVDYADEAEDRPPGEPERTGAAPFEGAKVAPVLTTAKGFEKVEVGSPEAVSTGSDGRATLEFTTPGWHRLKATVASPGGGENVIRSNRLDICVPPEGAPGVSAPLEGAGGCGELPAADQARTPPATIGEVEGGEVEPPSQEESGGGSAGADPGSGGVSTATPPPPTQPSAKPVRVTVPRLDRRDIAKGRIGVSWRVLSPGAGIARWTISAKKLGRGGGGYVSRATGVRGTSALLRLPPGSYQLRFSVTDLLGRSSTVTIGRVVVPR